MLASRACSSLAFLRRGGEMNVPMSGQTDFAFDDGSPVLGGGRLVESPPALGGEHYALPASGGNGLFPVSP